MKLNLKDITLFGVDTLDFSRLLKAATVCSSYANFGNIILLSNNDVTINNINDYSKFIIKDLPQYIKSEYVLIIQHDGFILNPSAWTDEFLEYDYIGAPWYPGSYTNIVGNGGFSLRSKKLIDRVSQLCYNNGNEDLFICNNNYQLLCDENFKFAPVELAKNFSVENIPWNGSFGFHDLRHTNINNWTDKQKFSY